MSRIGINQEQVFAVAQRLTHEKRDVTVQAVRDALGVGSYTTITNHLRQWREHSKPAPSAPPPPEVHAVAANAAVALWTVAHELAQRDADAIRKMSQEEICRAQSQTQEGLQEIARLEQHLQQSQQHNAEQQHHLEQTRQALTTAEHRLAADRATNEHLTARLIEIKAELDQVSQAHEQRTEECGRLRGELASRGLSDIKRKGSVSSVESR